MFSFVAWRACTHPVLSFLFARAVSASSRHSRSDEQVYPQDEHDLEPFS
jgi:hypothetical protein